MPHRTAATPHRNQLRMTVMKYLGTFLSISKLSKDLQFVQSLKYLGVFLVSAKHFKCTVDHIKVKFYRVFNCLYSRSKAAHLEFVTVELIQSYCLPLILYAIATKVMPLSATNIHVLENINHHHHHRVYFRQTWPIESK